MRHCDRGVRHSHLGLSYSHHGVRHSHLELRHRNLGVRHSHHGVHHSPRGMRHSHYGLRHRNLGVHHIHLGVRHSDRGLRDARRGLCDAPRGLCDARAFRRDASDARGVSTPGLRHEGKRRSVASIHRNDSRTLLCVAWTGLRQAERGLVYHGRCFVMREHSRRRLEPLACVSRTARRVSLVCRRVPPRLGRRSDPSSNSVAARWRGRHRGGSRRARIGVQILL